MKMINCFSSVIILLVTFSTVSISPASAQISTACTNALMSSFTPCLNYLTGSTNGGGSPTSDCCDALGALISSSTDCACLIVTGSVPIPINRSLAISLPKACKSKSVPLQCRASAIPLPGPGPVAFAPALPPLPPAGATVPAGSDSSTSQALPPFSSPSPPAPVLTPPAVPQTPTSDQPLLLPSSAAKLNAFHTMYIAITLLVLGRTMLNKF